MYQGYGQGYSGMYGAARDTGTGYPQSNAVPSRGTPGVSNLFAQLQKQTPVVPQGNAAPPSSTPSVSDLFAQLQRQIPGFENIPTPRAVIEQKRAQQELNQPFKGVSRSNLFVQCINRSGVEHGLKTDEQANVPSMNIFGTSRAQKSYKDYDVNLFSDILETRDKQVQPPSPKQKKEDQQKDTSQTVNSSTVTGVVIPTLIEGTPRNTSISGGPGTVPRVHQWQMHLMEYGSHDEHEHSAHLLPNYSYPPPQMYLNYPYQQRAGKNREGRSRSPRRDYTKDRRGDIERSEDSTLDRRLSRRSPDRQRRSPDRQRRSPDRQRRSSDRQRRSPDRQKRSPDRQRRSPDRQRRSPDRQRRSPDRQRRSPDRQRRSPIRQRRSPIRQRSSPIRQRSPNRRRRSPESHRQSSSRNDDNRRSRRDKSPDRVNSQSSKDDEPDLITRAGANSSLKDLKTLKSEYESFMKGIGEQHGKDFSTVNTHSQHDMKSESVFRRPLLPGMGSKPSHSYKQTPKGNSKFTSNYSEMAPPKIYDPKLSSKATKSSFGVKIPKETKRTSRETNMNPESDEDDEADFVNQLSQGQRTLIKKKTPPKHEILLKNPTGLSEEKRPNLSQYGTAHVQSHYDNERVRLSIALTSGKSTKESQSNIDDPRKPILGNEISNFIANFIRTVGKSKKGVQIVAKKYHLPGNCIGLTPPKMTHEVWDILKKQVQMRDETLQDLQRWLSLGVIPVIHQIDLFGRGEQEAKDVCRVTSDSLTVLGYVLFNMSVKRRLLMRMSLNKKYATLCRTSNDVTNFLFGDNLARELIEIKFGTYKIEKSKEEDNDDMQSPNYKPTFFAGLAVPGFDVDNNVASMINMACANEGDVDDLKEKYKIPSNCDSLIPAKINPEMWSLLSRSGLELDYKLQDVQLSIAEATVPLMRLLESVHERRYDPCEALEMLTDALALLGNSVYQLNKARMDTMLKTLPETVHEFGHWYWPGAEQVSGENLEEELKVSEDVNYTRRVGLILGVMQSQKTQVTGTQDGLQTI